MLFRLEVVPLGLHLAVQFQFHVAFGVLEAQLLVDGDEVGEEQGVDTLVLVFGLYGHQHQVQDVRAALEEQGFQQVEPAERQQTAVRLLQGTCQARHGDTHGHQLILCVGDER